MLPEDLGFFSWFFGLLVLLGGVSAPFIMFIFLKSRSGGGGKRGAPPPGSVGTSDLA